MSSARTEPPWANASVRAFAGGRDPLRAASEAAASLLGLAQGAGVAGPPVNVVQLAKVLGIVLEAGNTVVDAAISPTAPDDGGDVRSDLLGSDTPLKITYNPSRPRGRLRFSIAHEIAHALFPDVAEAKRHRTLTGAAKSDESDEWELELLCNVIAAELLLPDDAVAGLLDIDTDIDFIMETRKRWDVSTEALLRRLVTASRRGLSMVAASRTTSSPGSPLRVDYAIGDVEQLVTRGQPLKIEGSAGAAPYAVGQTIKTTLTINNNRYSLQAVGAPPYQGQSTPRVLALLEPVRDQTQDSRIRWVTGDITEIGPGSPAAVIGHVVSDSSRAWSRQGVAAALARVFPQAAAAYRSWTIASPDNLTLGNVHGLDQALAGQPVTVASMVAQQGYGPGVTTRLNYPALRECLTKVAAIAKQHEAEVHLPRIGAGQAGGRWDLIEAAVVSELCDVGLTVYVHTLPNGGRRG